VSKTERPGEITGRISANPNPLPFGQGHVVISWETNDRAGVEVRVLAAPGNERLVRRGKESGQIHIPWITDSTTYDFRLYGASRPESPIDSVKVRWDLDSAPMILRELATAAKQGNIDIMEVSKFIVTVMPRCLHSEEFHEIFPIWEQHGFHVTPAHFYQPVPEIRTLPETLWDRPSELVGIDINEPVQLDLMREHFPKFREEYLQFPTEPTQKRGCFYLNNGLFGGLDALVAYCMVRHFRPRLIVEIGSGFSSLILAEALAKNNEHNLICIDPSPQTFLKENFRGLKSLIEKRVQDIDVDFFSQLDPGDILFIDSSHTVKIGGDVNYLFLEVLPRLKPGVIVHVHDIFLPFDYPREWVLHQHRFWTEQYLLQTFLMFNSEFEVLMANNYLNNFRQEDLKATFPTLQSCRGGSFWIRRRSQLK